MSVALAYDSMPLGIASGFLTFSERRRAVADHDLAALEEARDCLKGLTRAEYRGPSDTIGAARARVARRIGIRPSYASRLWNRAAEMTGVAGGAYRALKQAYERQCESIEGQGERYRLLREALRDDHEASGGRSADPLALADVEAGRPPPPKAASD